MSTSLSSRSFRLTITLLLALMVLPAWGADKIILDGSSGMLPLAKALVTAYQQKVPDPQVEIGKGLGTGERLQALAEGKIQIALASHGIKPEDIQKGNLKVIEVAKGAIVFAGNASVPMTTLPRHRFVTFTAVRSEAGNPWVVRTVPLPCSPGRLRR